MIQIHRSIIIGTSFLLMACSGDNNPSSSDTDHDSGSAADTDTDTDSYTDTDTDSDSDADCSGAYTFCDGFDGEMLDLEKWWYGRKVWGIGNNGIIPENVDVHDGHVWFAANGDHYSGSLFGMRKAGGYIQDQPGDRTGGLIVSDAYFGPGRYEFNLALPSSTGVCSALWTFHYQELYSDHPSYNDPLYDNLPTHGNENDGWYKTPNHEIDIEIPTALLGEPETAARYSNARYNTWVGETVYAGMFFDNGYAYNDGAFHTWRFDWHTGDEARVEFYIDDQLMYTSTSEVPVIHGRLWLGTWFPTWAGGGASFDVAHMILDWVRFTAFDEPYRTDTETYPGDGLTKCQTKAENDANLPACQLVN